MSVEEKKIKVSGEQIIDQSKDNLCHWNKESKMQNGKGLQKQNESKIFRN